MSVLNKELWLPVVLDKIYEGYNQMSGISTEDSTFLVKSGSRFRKAYIPNAGSVGNFTKNSTDLVLSASRRTDTAVEYSLDKYEIGPHAVERDDILSVSYDKINSVVSSMTGKISEGIAYEIRKNWYVDDYEIETSGSGATATHGTGDRKTFTYADLMLAKKKLDAQKMPMTDRFAVLSATHANDLLDDLFTKNYNVRWTEKDNLSILDQKIAGFTIVQMPICLFGEVSGSTIEVLDYEESATDPSNLVEISLTFHKEYVSMSKDEVHIFYNEGDALHRGDVLTIQSFAGGAPRSTDNLGIVPIVGAIA